MPFILRRTKDQVLKDLPPKVIQDVLVEPSAIQKALLPLLRHTGSEAVATAKDEQAGEGKASVHVFQSLQVCKAPHVHISQSLMVGRDFCWGHGKAVWVCQVHFCLVSYAEVFAALSTHALGCQRN